MNSATRSHPASRWSLWLLLTSLLAFGGFVALPSLQAVLPASAATASDHLLADEWHQQRWLLSSRDLLRQQHAATQVDEHSPSFDSIWLAAAGMPPVLLAAAGFARFTAFSLPALQRRTLPGAPRGPPATLL